VQWKVIVHRKAIKRLALVVAGGFVLTGVVLAAVTFLGETYSPDSTTAAYGWIIPIITGAVIGLVAFLLLDTEDVASGTDVGLRSTSCASCGAEVIDEWRMCPHCGAMLDGEAASRKDYRTRAIL
jgi:hypothetical protein